MSCIFKSIDQDVMYFQEYRSRSHVFSRVFYVFSTITAGLNFEFSSKSRLPQRFSASHTRLPRFWLYIGCRDSQSVIADPGYHVLDILFNCYALVMLLLSGIRKLLVGSGRRSAAIPANMMAISRIKSVSVAFAFQVVWPG